jgi:hypothetical protein
MTGTGTSGTINGEANLQFNGNTLELTGAYRLKHDLAYLSSSVTGYGDILNIGTGSLTAGNLYYLNASQVWTATDSDVVASADSLIGIALGSSPTTDGVLIRGYVRNASWSFTTGAKLYLSGTPSGITSTVPTTTGTVIRHLGYSIDSTNNRIYFNPSNEWLEN